MVISADVGVVDRGIGGVVGAACTWFPSVVTAPSDEVGSTRISGLVGWCCFSGVVCTTTMVPVVKASVLDRMLALVTGA